MSTRTVMKANRKASQSTVSARRLGRDHPFSLSHKVDEGALTRDRSIADLLAAPGYGHAFGGTSHSCPPLVQPKLTINKPNDWYEQEADRVADAVMRMPEPGCSECDEEEGLVQARPLATEITPLVQRQVEPEEEEEEELIQTKQDVGQTHQVWPGLQSRIHFLKGGGMPLSRSVRDFFESRFGHDFSQVRVHTDVRASQTAQLVKGQAFTLGNNIVFGAGKYAPTTLAGRRLLAHELTHTVQQGAAFNRANPSLCTQGAIQRRPQEALIPEEEQTIPDPGGEESFVAGNSMDFVKGESPAESGLAKSIGIPKSPKGKAKAKFGGPLGPVEEGMGEAAAGLSPKCAEWIKIARTTYPYDPSKGADPLEKDFLKTYKDFKEGVTIAKPTDFNKKLKKATASPCTCLEKLNIDGHGGSWSGGVQEYAPRKYTSLGKRSFGVKKGADGKLVPFNFHVFKNIRFCKPCTITLGGCYVAINTPKPEAGKSGIKGAGDALGKALAKKTGCSVRAYTEITTTPKAGEFKGSGTGKWVVMKPEK